MKYLCLLAAVERKKLIDSFTRCLKRFMTINEIAVIRWSTTLSSFPRLSPSNNQSCSSRVLSFHAFSNKQRYLRCFDRRTADTLRKKNANIDYLVFWLLEIQECRPSSEQTSWRCLILISRREIFHATTSATVRREEHAWLFLFRVAMSHAIGWYKSDSAAIM